MKASKKTQSNIRLDPIHLRAAATSAPTTQSRSGGDRATLYTLLVSLEPIDVGAQKNAGGRLVIADMASVRAGKPAYNHG
eukprot:1386328-Pyramimonas_sp.AAC.1